MIIYLNSTLICFLLFLYSCVTWNKKIDEEKNTATQYVFHLPYANECHIQDTFSVVGINECWILKSRFALLEELFGFPDIDSVFVFAIEEKTLKRESKILDIEIWHKLSPKEASLVIDSLETLKDKTLFYKPPTCWDWFIYNDNLFFLNYMAGVGKKDLEFAKAKVSGDTVLLNYVLRKLDHKACR